MTDAEREDAPREPSIPSDAATQAADDAYDAIVAHLLDVGGDCSTRDAMRAALVAAYAVDVEPALRAARAEATHYESVAQKHVNESIALRARVAALKDAMHLAHARRNWHYIVEALMADDALVSPPPEETP